MHTLIDGQETRALPAAVATGIRVHLAPPSVEASADVEPLPLLPTAMQYVAEGHDAMPNEPGCDWPIDQLTPPFLVKRTTVLIMAPTSDPNATQSLVVAQEIPPNPPFVDQPDGNVPVDHEAPPFIVKTMEPALTVPTQCVLEGHATALMPGKPGGMAPAPQPSADEPLLLAPDDPCDVPLEPEQEAAIPPAAMVAIRLTTNLVNVPARTLPATWTSFKKPVAGVVDSRDNGTAPVRNAKHHTVATSAHGHRWWM